MLKHLICIQIKQDRQPEQNSPVFLLWLRLRQPEVVLDHPEVGHGFASCHILIFDQLGHSLNPISQSLPPTVWLTVRGMAPAFPLFVLLPPDGWKRVLSSGWGWSCCHSVGHWQPHQSYKSEGSTPFGSCKRKLASISGWVFLRNVVILGRN